MQAVISLDEQRNGKPQAAQDWIRPTWLISPYRRGFARRGWSAGGAA